MRGLVDRVIAIGLLLSAVVNAKGSFGATCSQSDNRVDSTTGSFYSDCDATTYCADNSTCAYKGCRSDEYPYGYNGVSFKDLPPRCDSGYFCPDEGDTCLAQIEVGGACQLDRDDECQPPPNGKQLDGFTNVNGSICLNYVCYWANRTVGQSCIIENRAYTSYGSGSTTYATVFSRDNCANGFYCDGTALQCIKGKAIGVACGANKECLSYNCSPNGHCLKATSQPDQPAPWVYAVVVVSVVLLIAGTLVGLFFIHRRNREETQIRLETYYNEQIAYRKSIMSLHQARNSLMVQPQSTADGTRRSSSYDEPPGLHNRHYSSSGSMQRRESSLRDGWSEAGDSDALLVSPRKELPSTTGKHGQAF